MLVWLAAAAFSAPVEELARDSRCASGYRTGDACYPIAAHSSLVVLLTVVGQSHVTLGACVARIAAEQLPPRAVIVWHIDPSGEVVRVRARPRLLRQVGVDRCMYQASLGVSLPRTQHPSVIRDPMHLSFVPDGD